MSDRRSSTRCEVARSNSECVNPCVFSLLELALFARCPLSAFFGVCCMSFLSRISCCCKYSLISVQLSHVQHEQLFSVSPITWTLPTSTEAITNVSLLTVKQSMPPQSVYLYNREHWNPETTNVYQQSKTLQSARESTNCGTKRNAGAQCVIRYSDHRYECESQAMTNLAASRQKVLTRNRI